VTHWRLNFISRRFGTLCLFLHPAYTTYEARTDREFWNVGKYNSEAGKSSKERIQHSEHGEILKSRNTLSSFTTTPIFTPQ
jgi:hypothetical protein